MPFPKFMRDQRYQDLLILMIRDSDNLEPSPRDWALLKFCMTAEQMELPFPDKLEPTQLGFFVITDSYPVSFKML